LGVTTRRDSRCIAARVDEDARDQCPQAGCREGEEADRSEPDDGDDNRDPAEPSRQQTGTEDGDTSRGTQLAGNIGERELRPGRDTAPDREQNSAAERCRREPLPSLRAGKVVT
jgi:hypothetical protein